jgi:DinB superfamily
MIYHSIADIFAANDDVRQRLVERVEGLSETEQHFRPAAGAWSAAEIAEHLSLIEGNMVRLVGKLLRQSESAGAAAGTPMQPFSLDEFAAQARTQKFVAPEAVRPHGVSVTAALAALRASRAALHALRPRIEAADGTRISYPHPIFGPLNLYQWLAFIGLHEGRHLHQLEGLLAGLRGDG